MHASAPTKSISLSVNFLTLVTSHTNGLDGRLLHTLQIFLKLYYTYYEVVLGISGQVWSWNARTRLPEILIFRLNKTRGLVMLRLIGTEHSYL